MELWKFEKCQKDVVSKKLNIKVALKRIYHQRFYKSVYTIEIRRRTLKCQGIVWNSIFFKLHCKEHKLWTLFWNDKI